MLLTIISTQSIYAESKQIDTEHIVYEEISQELNSFLIREIRFEGNKKTRPQVMLQEMNIKQGDIVSRKQIAKARQYIMDLGLFKSVNVKVKAAESGYVLLVKVNEKFYWFAIPKLNRNSDGDISYGAEFQTDNMFGLNQRLELVYIKRDLQDADVEEEQTVDLNYFYPRVMGSPWDFRFRYRLLLADLDEQRDELKGRYERDLKEVLFRFSRWLRTTGPSKGWRIGGSLSLQQYGHTFIEGDPDLFFDANVVALQFSGSYRDVNDFLYSRAGKHFGYDIEMATDVLGSDVDYVRHFLFYRKYALVTKRQHTNFNTQLRLETQTNSIFGDPALGVAGSRNLRGYDRQSLEGDAYVLGNFEMLSPLRKNSRSLRGILFLDVGNAFDGSSDIDLTELKYGAGFGIRWKIKSFVRLDLRLEVGRGISDGGITKVYAGTKGTF